MRMNRAKTTTDRVALIIGRLLIGLVLAAQMVRLVAEERLAAEVNRRAQELIKKLGE